VNILVLRAQDVLLRINNSSFCTLRMWNRRLRDLPAVQYSFSVRVCCFFVDNETLLSCRNFEMLIATQFMRAADCLSAVRRYVCERRQLSVGETGCSRRASVTGDVTTGWKVQIWRISRKRCSVLRSLCKTKSRARRGRTSLHCKWFVMILEMDRKRNCFFCCTLMVVLQIILKTEVFVDRVLLCNVCMYFPTKCLY